ncbi:MAG TPA: sodium-dependent bicarbonate transport family permease, partial [Pirellulales bacterium]
MAEILASFWDNFRHNLFKPLLLFFYMGFLVPILKVPFEFPYQVYQGLTIFLLVSIGWKGGEELASLKPEELKQALGFMLVGFITNFIIGVVAYGVLRGGTKLRKIDAATVAGYYGSDSAGTFATCVGVLGAVGLSFAAYMPVMLAIMEIPGCLVALFLVSKLRLQGMDAMGNMPGELGYDPRAVRAAAAAAGHGAAAHGAHAGASPATIEKDRKQFLGFVNFKLLHELFLNQGLYLLLGGIVIGFVSRYQGEKVSAVDDPLFISLFQGLLCLFLLEMGIT